MLPNMERIKQVGLRIGGAIDKEVQKSGDNTPQRNDALTPEELKRLMKMLSEQEKK